MHTPDHRLRTSRSPRPIACWLTCALLALAGAAFAAGPPKDIRDEANRTAAEQLRRFGEGYSASFDGPRRLLYISALDDAHFRQTTSLLAAYCDAQRKTLLTRQTQWLVTVILPSVEDFRPLAPTQKVLGFYRPTDRTLIAVDRGRVLLHEFTHALHHADMAAARQSHPIWVCEALATLFESCRITPQGLVPQVDTRLTTLKKALADKTIVPLDRFVKLSNDEFGRNADICYAQARYLLLHLHEEGLLRAWYEAYRAGYDKDKTGRAALEKTLRKPLGAIERDWHKWLAQLEMPWGEARSGQARLGVQVAKDSRGVKVVSLVRNGAAEQAGRIEVGDIIQEFNGQAIANPAQFIAAVRSAGAMQTVKVKLLRHGRPTTILQPLHSAQ